MTTSENDIPRPSTTVGYVYLAGAGPGDPGLMTRRTTELLSTVDVVAYDKLISPAILAMIPEEVPSIEVGRRSGAGKVGFGIHPRVLELAKAGKRVLRLKAGDPLVFGRGGEEAQALAEKGIPFEIVPGISAALGGAAYAGIPLTHRSVASGVTFATGHDVDDTSDSRLPGPALSEGHNTVVLYMASRKLEANIRRLLRSGYPISTPAAYIAAATTPEQKVIVGDLSNLVDRTKEVDPNAPALIVVGEVVALRANIAWFESRPLYGKRVLVARARPGDSEIARTFRLLGAESLEMPSVRIESPKSYEALDAVLRDTKQYEAIVFSSETAVRKSIARLGALGLDVRAFPEIPLIAIGEAASRRLLAGGLQPAVVAHTSSSEALEDSLRKIERGELAVLGSNRGRPTLVAELADLGFDVAEVAAYRSINRFPKTMVATPDLVILPSSSAARAIYEGPFGEALLRVPALAIGDRTRTAAESLDPANLHQTERSSPEELVSAAISILSGIKPRDGEFPAPLSPVHRR